MPKANTTTTIVVALSFLAIAALFASSTVFVATGTTGQPNQNCEAIFPSGPLTPQGFNTAGFNQATSVYAGSGQNTMTPASSNAVSQYDVACFQNSQH